MTYIGGFVTPVLASKKEEYRRFALESVPLFHEFGSSRMVEAWGDEVPEGKLTDYYRSVGAEPGEAIVFSWQEFRDAEAAAEANRKMMDDPRMRDYGNRMPFDGMRMIFGGFDAIFEQGVGGEVGYVDGAVVPVKTSNRDAYADYCAAVTPVFMENGALRLVEGWGVDVPDGKVTDFKRAVAAEVDESVVFSFIEWPSKQVRDQAWPRIFEDARMQAGEGLVDERRRIFGGFVPIVDA